MNSTFRTVTIAGSTGSLGYSITEALLNDGSYKVKILRAKPESENKKADTLVSKGAEIVYADYDKEDDLVKALEGTDVLICTIGTMKGDLYDIQCKLLAAAKKVGVKRFIPSEFGLEHKSGTELITEVKDRFQKDLEKSGLEYTCIFPGLFQEYLGLAFDVANKTAKFSVDSNTKLATTALADIGKYTVESLKLPEARNANIRVAGAILTLNEYLQMFEEASGSKWNVVYDKETQRPPLEQFKAIILEHGSLENIDNDKFSFTPRPVTEAIKKLVSQNN